MATESTLPASCVSLARYCEIVGIYEPSFRGVRVEDVADYECHDFWTEAERRQIARYLAEAQGEIEQQVGYPLCRKWIENEEHSYSHPLQTELGYVVAGGRMTTQMILADAAVNYATEPATVGPIATTLTDTNEIHVYYPDSDREIELAAMEIDGGFLTIWIPRWRLVSPDYFNESRQWPVDYSDLLKFTSTVSVVRVYNDPTDAATLIYYCGRTETTKAANIIVKRSRIGLVAIDTGCSSWRSIPDRVLLNYYAGRHPVTYQAEDAIIRLAHSKMPDEPCGCEVAQRAWARDRKVPDVLTRERLNCPFGIADGAWVAWQFAQSMRLVRGSGL
jgi:hypothetical protein